MEMGRDRKRDENGDKKEIRRGKDANSVKKRGQTILYRSEKRERSNKERNEKRENQRDENER